MVRAAFAYREQRRHPRKAVHPRAAFALESGPRIEAYCRDLSLGGAFFEVSAGVLYAAKIEVFLEIEGQEVAIPATVRWTSPEGIGVQFGLLGARETSLLVALLGD